LRSNVTSQFREHSPQQVRSQAKINQTRGQSWPTHYITPFSLESLVQLISFHLARVAITCRLKVRDRRARPKAWINF